MQYHGKILMIIGLAFFARSVPAQNTIPAAGGNAGGSAGSVSYTIGQIAVTPVSGSGGTINHGVQQPFEISVITGISGTGDIRLEIQAYPNPASDFVLLKTENNETGDLKYMLYDMNGSILQNNKVEAIETKIILGSYPSGIYFLKVILGNKEMKTFKIVKNQ